MSIVSQDNSAINPTSDLDTILAEMGAMIAASPELIERVYSAPEHDWDVTEANRYKGSCPWHNSSTGTSFYVRLDDNACWNCAGCSDGGTALRYRYLLRNTKEFGVGIPKLPELRGSAFHDELQDLAELIGYKLPARKMTPEQLASAKRIHDRQAMLTVINHLTVNKFWSDTPEAINARKYFTETRGFTEAQLREFEFGLMPSASEVTRHLKINGFSLEFAHECSVLAKSDYDSQPYCPLSKYGVVPWRDEKENIINIYGRFPGSVVPSKKTKSLPNPIGEWFKGKRSPFLFDRVLKAGHREIVIVEGLLDGIMAHAHGDTRVVALVGNKITVEQLAALKGRGIQSATIVLDGDTGGRNGTYTTTIVLSCEGITPYVGKALPEGKDPDEIIIEQGIDAWMDLSRRNNRQHGFCWIANHIIENVGYAPDSPDEVVVALQGEVKVFLSKIKGSPNAEKDLGFFWKELTGKCDRIERIDLSDVVAEEPDSPQNSIKKDLFKKFDEIYTQGMSYAETQIQLASVEGIHPNEVSRLWKAYKRQRDDEEELVDVGSRFSAVVAQNNQTLNPFDFFPNSLAKEVDNFSRETLIDPSPVILQILVGAASLVGAKANYFPQRVEQFNPSKIKSKPLSLYFCLINHPSKGKSFLLDEVFAFHQSLEKSWLAEFSEKNSHYKSAVDHATSVYKSTQERKEYLTSKGAEKPEQKTFYYTENDTIPGVADSILRDANHPGGLFVIDEMGKFFESQASMSGGSSAAAKTFFLRAFGGQISFGLRKNKDNQTDVKNFNPRLSCAGGCQPTFVPKFFDCVNDTDGMFRRFLVCCLPPKLKGKRAKRRVNRMGTMLENLYGDVLKMPSLDTLQFTEEAEDYYYNQQHEFEIQSDLCFNDKNTALGGVYGTANDYIGRMAALLSIIKQTLSGGNPAVEIELEHVIAAEKLFLYHVGQIKKLQSIFAYTEETLENKFLRVYEKIQGYTQTGKDCTPAILNNELNKKKKVYEASQKFHLIFQKSEILNIINELKKHGYAHFDGELTMKTQVIAIEKKVGDAPVTMIDAPEVPTPTKNPFQPKPDLIPDSSLAKCLSFEEIQKTEDLLTVVSRAHYEDDDIIRLNHDVLAGRDSLFWVVSEANENGTYRIFSYRMDDFTFKLKDETGKELTVTHDQILGAVEWDFSQEKKHQPKDMLDFKPQDVYEYQDTVGISYDVVEGRDFLYWEIQEVNPDGSYRIYNKAKEHKNMVEVTVTHDQILGIAPRVNLNPLIGKAFDNKRPAVEEIQFEEPLFKRGDKILIANDPTGISDYYHYWEVIEVSPNQYGLLSSKGEVLHIPFSDAKELV